MPGAKGSDVVKVADCKMVCGNGISSFALIVKSSEYDVAAVAIQRTLTTVKKPARN